MALGPVFERGALAVHWAEGALYLEHAGEGLLLDASLGAVTTLEALGALPRVQSLLLTSGRTQSVAGLVPLLCAMEPHRRTDTPLCVRTCLDEDRGIALASAWSRAWPDRYPLLLDSFLPGAEFDTGPFDAVTIPVRHGEPRWLPAPEVVQAAAVAVRVRVDGLLVAFVPGAAPGPEVRRALRGADLAVIEVGAIPWPQSDRRWRLGVEEALEHAEAVGEVWVVGDDGRFGLPGHREDQ